MSEEKIEFYKWDKKSTTPWEFELVEETATEDYKVWDNKNKRFMWNGTMPDGVPFEDTRMMKSIEFTQRYKDDYRKATQYIYNIELSGERYKIGFPYSVHTQIQDKLETLRGVGATYSTVKFIMTSNGEDGLKRKYTVRTERKGSSVDAERAANINLTDQEQKLVDGAKQIGGVDEAMFLQFASSNKVTEERAKEIFATFF